MGGFPNVEVLHGNAEGAAQAAQEGEQEEGEHDVLVQLLLFESGLAVGIGAPLPADGSAGETHAEHEEGHEDRVAPLDQRGWEVERGEGRGEGL